MIGLPERADIYRLSPDVSKAGRTSVLPWRKRVACHVEPISAIDHTVQFALESTHVIYLPAWLRGLRREDELRIGGYIDSAGKRLQRRYIVKGIRRFPAFGLRHIAAYCQERE